MRFPRFFCPLALAITLLETACVIPPRQLVRPGSCEIQSEGTLAISVDRIEMAPGETRQLPKPMVFTAPYLPPDTLATDCKVRWSVEGGGTIDSFGRLTLARDVQPGGRVVVRAHADTLVAQQDVHVVDPAPNPLAASWSQTTAPVCTNGESATDAIVRALVFRRGGTYSVTRVPFESYRDYWGTYSYDVGTGKLRLTVEGGNSVPGFRTAELLARIVNGELNLEGTTLAGARSGDRSSSCRSVFRRIGEPR